jgi:DNA-binding MarR family transcriptional regulator
LVRDIAGPSPSSRIGGRAPRRSVSGGGVGSVVPGWQGSETLDALQELVDLGSAVPVAVARRAGLSVSELHALRHLMESPRTPGDLGRLLGVTSAASSGVVDRLVAHGHAERRPHGVDGRRTEVVVTDSGRVEVLGLLRPMFAALGALDQGLSDRDRMVVERFLRGAADALRTVL